MNRRVFFKTAAGGIAAAPAIADAMQAADGQTKSLYDGTGTVQDFLKAAYQLRDFYNTPQKTERIVKLDEADNVWIGFDSGILSQLEEKVIKAPAQAKAANTAQTSNTSYNIQGTQDAQGQASAPSTEIYAKDDKIPLQIMITRTKGTTKERDVIGYTSKGGRFDEEPDLYVKGDGATVDLNNKPLFKKQFRDIGQKRLKDLIEGMYTQFSQYVPAK